MSERPEPKRKRQLKKAKAAPPAAAGENELRDAAYYLWESEGKPDGRALDHWLQAAEQRAP